MEVWSYWYLVEILSYCAIQHGGMELLVLSGDFKLLCDTAWRYEDTGTYWRFQFTWRHYSFFLLVFTSLFQSFYVSFFWDLYLYFKSSLPSVSLS